VQVDALIAAVIGAVSGGGGVRMFSYLSRTGRDERLVAYYRRVIKGLEEENEALQRRLVDVNTRLNQLQERIAALELEPPAHLG
jgi:hypothetical protein